MPVLNVDRADFLREEDIVIFEDSVAKFLDEHAPSSRVEKWREAGIVERAMWREAGEAGPSVLGHPGGLRRRRRRLSPRGRPDGADHQEGGQRLFRLAAQRDRRALHPALRLRRAEEELAAEDGLRRIHRRHRDVRAGRGFGPAGHQDLGATGRQSLRPQRAEDLHQQRPARRY